MKTDKEMLAMRAGTLIYCRPCDEARPSCNEGKRWITCDRGHRQNALTVGIALSTDDDEVPTRLLPPVHCRPAYQLEEMEFQRIMQASQVEGWRNGAREEVYSGD